MANNSRKLVELISESKMDIANMKDVQTVTFEDFWFGKNDIAVSEDGKCELHIGFKVGENQFALFKVSGELKNGDKFKLKLKPFGILE